jgi:multimeric flavodoxin WrbA
MANVVGIVGSPRRDGNSEVLLDRFLAGARAAGGDVTKIVAVDLDVEACVDCERCWEDGRCVTDDEYEVLCNALIAADVVAVASPLYFWNVPAQLKVLIDRAQCMWARKFKLKEPLPPSTSGHDRRRGVFICVGGGEKVHFEGAARTVRSFFEVYETDYWDAILVSNVDAKGEIDEEPLAYQEAYDLGFRAVAEAWT